MGGTKNENFKINFSKTTKTLNHFTNFLKSAASTTTSQLFNPHFHIFSISLIFFSFSVALPDTQPTYLLMLPTLFRLSHSLLMIDIRGEFKVAISRTAADEEEDGKYETPK